MRARRWSGLMAIEFVLSGLAAVAVLVHLV